MYLAFPSAKKRKEAYERNPVVAAFRQANPFTFQIDGKWIQVDLMRNIFS